jgi:3'-5' exoribonuclease
MTTAPARSHIDVASMQTNAYVEGVYSILNPQLGTTRAGKPYLKCLLRDCTGELPARQWTIEQGIVGQLEVSGFVYVAGHTQSYNGQVQLIIEQIRPAEVDEADLSRLIPTTTKNIDEMFNEASAIMRTLEHPAMRALVEAYLADEELMASFKRAPAAVSMHHAWIGGLLEHTLQLLQLAERMLPLYPQLSRDMVLAGLFLHDLAKTAELSWDKGFNYTTEGNLIGHIVRGAIWLQIKAAIAAKQSGQRLPGDTLRALQHIILSHHGEPENGAARLPSTPEAVFVALLDNLDAKTAMALAHTRADHLINDPGEWTDKVWALGTRMFRPNPLAAEEQ